MVKTTKLYDDGLGKPKQNKQQLRASNLEYKVGRSNDSIVIQGHVKPPTIVSKSKVTEKEKFF